MIASMTGFGKGEAEANGYRASVEVRSVNGRFGEVSVRLPRALAEFEPRIKEAVLTVLSRGRIDVSLSLVGHEAEQGVPVLNEVAVEGYRKGIEALKESLGVEGDITPLGLASLPNVFTLESVVPDPELLWPAVESACQRAVAGCQTMRRAEGEKLSRDLFERIHRVEELIVQVEARAPARTEEVQRRLEDKLAALLSPEQMDQSRVLMEVAILAERSDITEECVRFHSHNVQFLETLGRGDGVGRRLNFLVQEMLREANTIGSKAGDSEIIHVVVEIKEEIEKIREQVQNIE